MNVYNSGGTARVRAASAATLTTHANGCILNAVSNGATATVYSAALVTGLSGLTPGPIFLGTTPGALVSTPPTAAGNIVQLLGYAPDATSAAITPHQPYERA